MSRRYMFEEMNLDLAGSKISRFIAKHLLRVKPRAQFRSFAIVETVDQQETDGEFPFSEEGVSLLDVFRELTGGPDGDDLEFPADFHLDQPTE